MMNSICRSAVFFALAAVFATPLIASANDPWVVYEGKDGPGKGKHIVLICGDEEYRSEELIPQLAKILAVRHGFKCTVLFAIDKKDGTINPQQLDNIPGMEKLKTADLMVLHVRFRRLPDDQMQHFVDYLRSGKPILALRTSTHAFNFPRDSKWAKFSFRAGEPWPGGFGRQVLGETWVAHYGRHQRESTRGVIAKGMENHPLVRGLDDIWGPSDVYKINKLTGDAKPVIMGQVLTGMKPTDPPLKYRVRGGKKVPVELMPIAWIKTYTWDNGKTNKIFVTTMGHAGDLKNEGVRRMLVNAVYWLLGMEVPQRADVRLVGRYDPPPIGVGRHRRGVRPADLRLTDKDLQAGASSGESEPTRYWVYIGTYTRGASRAKGIYRAELDLTTGKLSTPRLAAEAVNPSFLAIHPSGKYVYAVGEIGYSGKKKTGGLSAFAIDSKTGDLKLLNQVSSGGAGPCHLVVDRTGRFVLAANYGGGSCCAVRILKDGRLGKMTAFQQHKGSSVNPRRQKGPHAHSINLDANNRFAFVADLGLDKILIYRFDDRKGTLTPNEPSHVNVPPGSGPRHFTFHPNGRYAYVINELANTVVAMKYDAEHGRLTPIQVISTLPADFKGTSYTAEVLVHPSGKYLYGSNRGHDSIAIFRIDQRSGKLRLLGHATSEVKTPRNFRIDPTGRYMLVGSQGSGKIVVFRIDANTGNLTPTGQVLALDQPVCFRMMVPPSDKR